MNAMDETDPRPRRALIVVDVQRDFCEGGSLAVTGGNAVATAITEFVAGQTGYDFVLATRDHHIDPGSHFSDQPDFVDSWPPHCVVGTPGVEFSDRLEVSFDAVFDKGEYEAAYSGFEGRTGAPAQSTDAAESADPAGDKGASDEGAGDEGAGERLTDWLSEHEVEQVDVCGLATDYCVRATALDAAAAGFDATVLLRLTAAVDPANIDRVCTEFEQADVRVER